MTRRSSADVGFLLADGYSILGQQTMLEDTQEAVIEETTVLGGTYEEHAYVGVKRYDLRQDGFYDDAANGNNVALVTPGASKNLAYAPEGNSIGQLFVGLASVQAEYVRNLTLAALHKARASYKSTAYEEGVILHELSAETASGDTEDTPHDNAASSAGGGVAHLQVSAITLGGFDDVTVRILDSSDDITYGLLQAFVDVTARSSQRIEVAGTIERYLASDWVFNGAGSGASITFFAGFARS